MSLLAVSIEIQGKVQGVWYRASAREEAHKLGLNGFVKNQQDGSVFIEVCGENDQVEQLINWCLKGPEHALVTELRIKKIEPFHSDKFEIIK